MHEAKLSVVGEKIVTWLDPTAVAAIVSKPFSSNLKTISPSILHWCYTPNADMADRSVVARDELREGEAN